MAGDMGSSLLSCMDLLKWLRYQQSGCSYKIGLQIQIAAQTNVFGQGILGPLSKTMVEYSSKRLELLLARTYATNTDAVCKIDFLNHVCIYKINVLMSHCHIPHFPSVKSEGSRLLIKTPEKGMVDFASANFFESKELLLFYLLVRIDSLI